MRIWKVMFSSAALLMLTACASVQTTWTQTAQASNAPGLVYWMPKQDVLVNVKFADGVPTATIEKTEPYADTSAGAFVATFRRNWVGKNELKVGITDQGLLQSAKATTTSNLSEVLTELAKSVGSFTTALDGRAKPAATTCPAKGDFTIRISVDGKSGGNTFDPPKSKNCSIIVQVSAKSTNLEPSNDVRTLVAPKNPTTASTVAAGGFFYRQNLPYDIKIIVGDLWIGESLVMLPNGSPTRYLPVSKSLFSNNVADLTFNKGVLTNYNQDADSEALSVVKLPANILTSYFTAIGSMFGTRSAAVKNQAEYETALLDALRQQYSNEQCIAALTAKDDAKIEAMCKQ